MMYIDQTALAVSQAWLTKASRALNDAVNAPTQEARRQVIKDNEKIWRAAKRELRRLSHKKCWYSEAPASGARQDVDHFRPKGAVRGIAHEGYWWLAFDWENFRLSCQICNQCSNNLDDGVGGKGDQFPVHDEADRVTYANRARMNREQHLLLDPCNRDDVGLLWFEDDGMPRPTMDEGLGHVRASESITIYNLKSGSLVSGRATQLSLAKKFLQQGRTAFEAMERGDATQRPALTNAMENLLGLQHPSMPFTRAISCYLSSHRSSEHPWIEQCIA